MVNARRVLGIPGDISLSRQVIEEAFAKKIKQIHHSYKDRVAEDDFTILETSVLSAKRFLLKQIRVDEKVKNPIFRLWKKLVPQEMSSKHYLYTTSSTLNGHTATHTYKEVQDQRNQLREESFYVDGQKVSGDQYRNALQQQHRVPYKLLTSLP